MKTYEKVTDLNKWIPLNMIIKKAGRILFVWPPSHYLNHSLFKHFTYFGETVSVLSEHGFDLDVIDCGVEIFSRRMLFNKMHGARYLVMPLELYNAKTGISLARIFKDFIPEGKVITYGTASSLIPNYISASGVVDYIVPDGNFVIGILSALFNDLTDKKSGRSSIMNVRDPEVRCAKPLLLGEELWGTALNGLLPLKEYRRFGDGMFEITMQVGCPWNCSFCSEKRLFPDFATQYRSINNAIAALRRIEADGWKAVYLSATTFTYDKDYVKRLCKAISDNGIGINWRAITRVDMVNREIIELMAASGLRWLSIGVETFQPEIQAAINKKIEIQRIRDVVNLCNDVGVKPRALLMIGLPGQNAEIIANTYMELKEMGADVRMKEYYPIQEISLLDKVDVNKVEHKLGNFERLAYRTDSVSGLSKNQYMNYLFPADFMR